MYRYLFLQPIVCPALGTSVLDTYAGHGNKTCWKILLVVTLCAGGPAQIFSLLTNAWYMHLTLGTHTHSRSRACGVHAHQPGFLCTQHVPVLGVRVRGVYQRTRMSVPRLYLSTLPRRNMVHGRGKQRPCVCVCLCACLCFLGSLGWTPCIESSLEEDRTCL